MCAVWQALPDRNGDTIDLLYAHHVVKQVSGLLFGTRVGGGLLLGTVGAVSLRSTNHGKSVLLPPQHFV